MMSDKPWMKFYPSDWRADPCLRMCSLAARGLWMEMIGLMHEASPYGHLIVRGRVVNDRQLAQLAGCAPDEAAQLLAELEESGVFSRTDEGVIFSRRMIKDEAREAEAKANGRKGGNPAVKGGVNPTVKGQDKAQKPEARSHIPDNHNPEAAALNPVARDAAAAMAEGAMGNPWTPILEAFGDGCVDGGGVRTFSGSTDDRLCAKRLMDAGATPEMVRFVTSAITERQKAKGKSQPSTIRYVERPVMDAIAEPPPDMPAPAKREGDLRRAQLERYIEKGVWLDAWGPRPLIQDAKAELHNEKVVA
jgi:hypothetical protein